MDRITDSILCYQHDGDEARREAAADDLLSEIYAPLMGFIRSRVAKQSAEDVMQETLKALFEGLWLFEGKSVAVFWGWVYGIARKKCADSFRGSKTTLSTIADPELLKEALAHLHDARTLPASDLADLHAALDLLKATSFPCLGWVWDHYVVGLTYEELGAQEGITEDAARKRVVRCLELAEELRSK